MAARFFLVLCASVLVQAIAAYPGGCGCGGFQGLDAGAIAGANIAAAGIAGAAANNLYGLGYAAPAYGPASIYTGPAIASAGGGTFGVSVTSPFAPSGITVISENSIDGTLEVIGSLPFLATVALEGAVPSSGAAGTSYSCGSGDVGISSESLAAAGIGSGLAASSQLAGAQLAGISAGLSGASYARPILGCNAY